MHSKSHTYIQCSRQSLKKYVKANNSLSSVTDKMFDALFNKALKGGVDKGIFEQPKGPSGGTKLAKKAPKKTEAKKPATSKSEDAPKKPAAKKATATKKDADAKKPAAKKATTTKKAAAPKKAVAPKKVRSTNRDASCALFFFFFEHHANC